MYQIIPDYPQFFHKVNDRRNLVQVEPVVTTVLTIGFSPSETSVVMLVTAFSKLCEQVSRLCVSGLLPSSAWVVIGYFSFFDFGIGRTLTKIVAEKIGLGRTEEIPGIFWTSFFLMLVISLIGTLVLIFFSPTLVYNFFNISKELQQESINTFYVLALSIPIVTTTAGLRGVLEAYQKFGIINIIRIILGVFTFLAPLICLVFTQSLFWIVIFLTLIRIVVWSTLFGSML